MIKSTVKFSGQVWARGVSKPLNPHMKLPNAKLKGFRCQVSGFSVANA
jgi:hypothetical protein